jgi:hypothetical protein
MPKLTAGLTAIVLALSLAACGEKEEPATTQPTAATQTGGGGDDGGSAGGGGGAQSLSAEEGVTAAVEAVIGGGVPAEACEEFATANYVKSAYGDAKGCEAAVKQAGKVQVEVTGVQVSGTKATAKAEPRSGPNKGETLTAQLVREGDTWKVDSLKSNAKVGP